MAEKMNDIDEFINALDSNIDLLVNINCKVDYSEDYEQGYSDSAHAIKNTAHTLAKKFGS